MLMLESDEEDEILDLAAGVIGTRQHMTLLGMAREDGTWCEVEEAVGLREIRDIRTAAETGLTSLSGVGGRALSLVPVRTHRTKFGYLVVSDEGQVALRDFVLQTIAHHTAVALAARQARQLLRTQASHLALSEARYRDLADRSPDVVWHMAIGDEAVVDYVSPSCMGIMGIAAEAFLADAAYFVATIDPEGISPLNDVLLSQRFYHQGDSRFLSTVEREDGTVVVLETQLTAVLDGVQGITRDMTDVRRLQAELTELAMRDPLTGLANRRLFDELLERALLRAGRSAGHVAVAYLDLDDFKVINDSYGHQAGDLVLRETAARIQANVRDCDVVCRVGGDEFVVLFDPAGPEAELVVDRVRRALSGALELEEGVSVRCPASIGWAMSGGSDCEPGALLARADHDMYQRKRARFSSPIGPASGVP